MSRVRMLVVDDSTLFRKVVRDVVASHPIVDVVGVAADGKQAIDKIEELKPDLVTLDMQMPVVDGLEVLRTLRGRRSSTGVIMLSSFTAQGAQETIQALELGAFDFILKPRTTSFDQSMSELRESLLPKIDAYAASKSLIATPPLTRTPPPCAEPVRVARNPTPLSMSMLFDSKPAFDANRAIVIGISTGGPSALSKMVPSLGADLGVPVAIVQHMPPMFTKSLADDLARTSRMQVVEAEDGMPFRKGVIHIAPGGKQMRLAGNFVAPVVQITDDAPEKNCKPSVDYLFRSAVQMFGRGTVACVMTGMGDDGCEGSRLVKQAQGYVIAQDQASSTVYGMPRMVIESGLADEVCTLDEIANALRRSVGHRGVLCK